MREVDGVMGSRGTKGEGIARHRPAAIAIAATVLLAIPALALAHVERASYWPDPAADTAVSPPAGGAVPAVRSLYTALDTKLPGDTHVVCQPDSLQRLDSGLAAAQTTGYKLRSSQPAIKVSTKDAQKLRSFNQKLFGACTFNSIQAAVTASGNNDRVVIMPGVYTEPASRAAPTHDPACQDYVETNDHGTTGALSYKYQFLCPNDQNLIAVMGRALTDVPPPQPPAVDRHGIPDAGPCIRCNVQIEGSGVSPDDVVIDGGDPALGDKGNPGPDPADYAKDNG